MMGRTFVFRVGTIAAVLFVLSGCAAHREKRSPPRRASVEEIMSHDTAIRLTKLRGIAEARVVGIDPPIVVFTLNGAVVERCVAVGIGQTIFASYTVDVAVLIRDSGAPVEAIGCTKRIGLKNGRITRTMIRKVSCQDDVRACRRTP